MIKSVKKKKKKFKVEEDHIYRIEEFINLIHKITRWYIHNDGM